MFFFFSFFFFCCGDESRACVTPPVRLVPYRGASAVGAGVRNREFAQRGLGKCKIGLFRPEEI